ncbi:hypothetical protein [Klebsiella pneumoniae IS46]|nr:hypothetical protein [Klebsiella pneumoniae IS46]
MHRKEEELVEKAKKNGVASFGCQRWFVDVESAGACGFTG